MSNDLFSQEVYRPLAARMRPDSLESFYGQQHLIGPNRPLRDAIDNGTLHSMVFWGPPGVGKTTLAKIIAARVDAHFESISAVLSGVKEIRASIAKAVEQRDVRGRKTILFVDEVHRFNKSQQDAFLPFVEDGTVVFIGATTENPSFELNNALLSRCRVYVLKTLSEDDIKTLVQRAIDDSVIGLGGQGLELDDKALSLIANAADGDARRALNLLEIASDLSSQNDGKSIIDQATLEQVLVGDTRRFDKGGEYFYDQISALHKSIRGSSTDASLYWLCRMLDGGCDPLYLARRLARIASEDIGNADPRALEITLNAWSVQERLGSPEGELALAQAVAYLALAPKSNATYVAYKAARNAAKQTGSEPPPKHILNGATSLMKDQGYGAGYAYDHDAEDGFSGQNYFPDTMNRPEFYVPVERGHERELKKRVDYFAKLRAKREQ